MSRAEAQRRGETQGSGSWSSQRLCVSARAVPWLWIGTGGPRTRNFNRKEAQKSQKAPAGFAPSVLFCGCPPNLEKGTISESSYTPRLRVSPSGLEADSAAFVDPENG